MPAIVLGASDLPAAPAAALIAVGALIALAGHLVGSRRTVVSGLAILFVASALMIVGGYLAYRDDPADPRPCPTPGAC